MSTTKNYQNSYLFAEINQRIQAFQQQHPERELIRLGIGDVTQPLPGLRASHAQSGR